MGEEFREAFANEWRRIVAGLARPAGAFRMLAGLAIFGFLIPWRLGLDFLDVLVLGPYACLSWLFVAPVVAEAFAGAGRGVPGVDARAAFLGRLGAALVYGVLAAMLLTAAGLAIVNLAAAPGRLLLPPARVLAPVTLIGAAGAFAVASASAMTALGARNAAEAKQKSRRAFLLLLVGAVFLTRQYGAGITSQSLGKAAFPLAAGLGALGALFLWVALRRLAPREDGPVFKI